VHYSVYAGIAFAAVFGVIAPWIARRVTPAVAAWMLTVGGAVAALSGIVGLGALAMTLVGQDPAVAEQGHWSISALHHEDPVRFPVAVFALAALAICLSRVAWVSVRRTRQHLAAGRLTRVIADNGSDLVILPGAEVDAYAVPGRPGRVFVTRGMLRLLTEAEFEVMLAHERAHLRRHHHRHRTAAALARAVNPLLRELPPTQDWVTERWADEIAASEGDRRVLASALRRAATAKRDADRPEAALALSEDAVETRVAAMLAEPPRRRPAMVAVAAAVLALSVYGTLDGITDEATLFHGATLHSQHAAPHF
jgi:Zn-dependent protease with chaperone function